jgi:phosphoribosylanthranilate isomerase
MSCVIKICGLSTQETLACALSAGADMVGFVFVAKSPRYVSHVAARDLARQVGHRAETVALLVDPDDAAIEAAIAATAADLIQLHGQETPERVRFIQTRFGRPVLKAVGVRDGQDLAALAPYVGVARHLLIDAKPPRDAVYPGGHGTLFDWSILAALDPSVPFMLSGGLTPSNVAAAVRQVQPWGLDVSSGVERAPGEKDVDKIQHFIANARAAADGATKGSRLGHHH